MAKNKKFELDDDFNVDRDFDFNSFDDFDFDNNRGSGKKRNPVTDFGKGVLRGAKDAALNPAIIRKTIKDTMPRGYGSVVQRYEDTAAFGRNLYDDLVKEAKPRAQQIGRSVQDLLSDDESQDNRLQGALRSLAKKLQGSEDPYASPSEQAIREQQMQLELNSLFASTSAKRAARSKKERVEQQSMDFAKHGQTIKELRTISQGIAQHNAYLEKIDANYKRKSLELQIRQYYTAVDSLKELKKANAMAQVGWRDVIKNTGLPDYLKLSGKERLSEMVRDRFFGGALNSMFDSADSYFSRLGKNVGDSLREKIIGSIGSIDDLLQEAAAGKQALSGAASMEGGAKIAGDLVGGFGAQSLMARLGRALNRRIEKSPRAKSISDILEYEVANSDKRLQQFARSSVGDYGAFGPLFTFIKDLIPQDQGVDFRTKRDSFETLVQPSPWTRQNSRSIDVVIPGYLARILREVTAFRTGNDKTGLIHYDYRSGSFTSRSSAGTQLHKDLFSSGGKESTLSNAQRLVDSVDVDKQLTEAQRKALQQELLYRNVRGESFDWSDMTNEWTWKSNPQTAPHAQAIAQMFKSYFNPQQMDLSGLRAGGKFKNSLADSIEQSTGGMWLGTAQGHERQNAFATSARDLGKMMGDPRQVVQRYIELGMQDLLEEYGVITATGEIDYRKIFDLYQKEGDPQAAYAARSGAKGRKGRRSAARSSAQSFGFGSDVQSVLAKDVRVTNKPDTVLKVQLVGGQTDDLLKVIAAKIPSAKTILRMLGRKTRRASSQVSGSSNAFSSFSFNIADTGKYYQDLSKSTREQLKGMQEHFSDGWDDWGDKASSFTERLGDRFASAKSSVKDWFASKGIYSASDAGNSLKRIIERFVNYITDQQTRRAAREFIDLKVSELKKAVRSLVEQSPKVMTLLEKAAVLPDRAMRYLEERVFPKIAQALEDDYPNQDWISKFARRSAKGLFGAAKIGIRSAFRGGRALSSLLKAGSSFAMSAGSSLGKTASELAQEGFGDIYIEGESSPRLTRAGLKAGKYFDKETGEPLTGWDQITSDVVDGDGMTLLKQEEFPLAELRGGLSNIALTTVARAKNYTGTAFNRVRAMSKGSFGVVGSTISGVKSWIERPRDVYVRGNDYPSLTALIMRNGGYLSKGTGKVIAKPKDIDGPVVDAQGNEVLSAADIQKGLVDQLGIPIGNAVGTALRYGKAVGLAVANRARKSVARAGTVLRTLTQGITSFTKGGLRSFLGSDAASLGSGSSQPEVVLLLTSIRDVLMDRLPQRKRVLGDSNGDGIRDNSLEDMARRAAAGGDPDDQAPSTSMGKTGAFAGLFGGIKSLYDKLKGGTDSADEGGDTNVLVDMGDTSDDKKGKKTAKKGRLGTLADRIKSKMGRSWLGRAAMGVGAGLLGAGKFVGRAAMSLGSLGVRGLMALLPYAGPAATALGAALASPVGLAALGVAAVGGAGYLGYKLLSSTELTPLLALRFAQYGFLESDKARLPTILNTEKLVEPGITFSGGDASLDESKINLAQIAQSFGVSANTSASMRSFSQWFALRFKPIYLAHRSILTNMGLNISLSEVDTKLTQEQKQTYLKAAQIPGGPYDILDNPFNWQVQLLAGHEAVKSAFEKAQTDLEKSAKPQDKLKDALAGTAAASAATTVMARDEQGNPTSEPLRLTQIDGLDTRTSTGVLIAAGASFSSTRKEGSRIDALTSIRYKTYGLVTMELDKVRALDDLENLLDRQVSYDSQGVARFVGSPEQTLRSAGAWFGATIIDNSTGGSNWLGWFRLRFLPAFLNYATALKQVTGKDTPRLALSALKATDSITVAQAVVGASTSLDGATGSVWKITSSPWVNYTLNTDASSVNVALQELRDLAKAVVLKEKSQSLASNQGSPGFVSSDTGGGAAMVYRGVKRNDAQLPAGSNASYTSTAGSTGSTVNGPAVAQSTGGAGGAYLQMAQSQGRGWEANKDMLSQAASMSGVDLSVLATTMAIESGFNPNAMGSSVVGNAAQGMGQMMPGTWSDTTKKYGGRYGIDSSTSAMDPRANALMTAEYIKENMRTLQAGLKRPLTKTDIYLAHFLGAAGAIKFLQADPSALGKDVLPAAAKNNPQIFFDKTRPRTIGEIYQLLQSKVESALSAHNAVISDAASFDPKNVLEVTLQRDPSTPSGMFGTLTLPDGTTFQTLELAWRDNERAKSAIPAGTYLCKIRQSAKFGEVYEVMGVPGRSAILIHAGNTAGDTSNGQKSDVSGCILLGTSRGKIGDQPAVLGSKDAMAQFMAKTAARPLKLTIRSAIADVDVGSARTEGQGATGAGLSPLVQATSTSISALPTLAARRARSDGGDTGGVPQIGQPQFGGMPAPSPSVGTTAMTAPDLPLASPRQAQVTPAQRTAQTRAQEQSTTAVFDQVRDISEKQLAVQTQTRDMIAELLQVVKTQGTPPETGKTSNRVLQQRDAPKSVVNMN